MINTPFENNQKFLYNICIRNEERIKEWKRITSGSILTVRIDELPSSR
jgi:hypothetical protein